MQKTIKIVAEENKISYILRRLFILLAKCTCEGFEVVPSSCKLSGSMITESKARASSKYHGLEKALHSPLADTKPPAANKFQQNLHLEIN